jgi:Ca-activated chloride channel family protein
VEPAEVPDLFARRPVVVFGKWRGRPQGTIELRGRTGQDPYRASFSPSEAPRPPDHRTLRYLWARTRIANLSDLGGRGDETARAAVTQLGLTYNLLTQYTSFIAVEELIRNAGGEGRDVDQPLPLPVGVSDLGVGQAVTGGAEPELTYLAAALVLMLAGLRVLRSRRTGTAAS